MKVTRYMKTRGWPVLFGLLVLKKKYTNQGEVMQNRNNQMNVLTKSLKDLLFEECKKYELSPEELITISSALFLEFFLTIKFPTDLAEKCISKLPEIYIELYKKRFFFESVTK